MPGRTSVLLFGIIAIGAGLTGCATTQLSSGADYLNRSNYPSEAISPPYVSDIDQDIRDIAAVEPDLKFPARIGIAYIEQGSLKTLPPDHGEAWHPVTERVDGQLGEIVPISPLIAQMVSTGPASYETRVSHLINSIRRGAARQHVDYVLIYEISEASGRQSNCLRLADWSVLGLFIIPSRDVDVVASGSAILIDVRTGYPYGTASGVATRDGIATPAGANSKRAKLAERAEKAAVSNLAKDVIVMIDTLVEQVSPDAFGDKTVQAAIAKTAP